MSSSKEILHFKRDSIIFKEGDKADCMYKVKYGFVEIYLNYKEKNQKLLTRIGHDEFFGEMALLDDTVRSATAVSADSTTQLIAYSKEDLLKGNDESSAVRSDLLRQMSDHLVRLTDTYMDVCKTIAYYKASEEVGKTVDIDLQKAIDMYSAMYMTY